MPRKVGLVLAALAATVLSACSGTGTPMVYTSSLPPDFYSSERLPSMGASVPGIPSSGVSGYSNEELQTMAKARKALLSGEWTIQPGETIETVMLATDITLDQIASCNDLDEPWEPGTTVSLSCEDSGDFDIEPSPSPTLDAPSPSYTPVDEPVENPSPSPSPSHAQASKTVPRPRPTEANKVSPLLISPAPTTPAEPPILWEDHVDGYFNDNTRPPPCGMWKFITDDYLIREIACPGSARYLNLEVGDRIKIDGMSCRVLGDNRLNFNTDNIGDVNTYGGNYTVQTCYPNTNGPVRVVAFQCD